MPFKHTTRAAYTPGEDPVPPKEGDVGLVCQIDDVYHDNKARSYRLELALTPRS